MASNYSITDAFVPLFCAKSAVAGYHSKSPDAAPSWHSRCYHILRRNYDPVYDGTRYMLYGRSGDKVREVGISWSGNIATKISTFQLMDANFGSALVEH